MTSNFLSHFDQIGSVAGSNIIDFTNIASLQKIKKTGSASGDMLLSTAKSPVTGSNSNLFNNFSSAYNPFMRSNTRWYGEKSDDGNLQKLIDCNIDKPISQLSSNDQSESLSQHKS